MLLQSQLYTGVQNVFLVCQYAADAQPNACPTTAGCKQCGYCRSVVIKSISHLMLRLLSAAVILAA